ncbi:MAG TPA: hypothetical protein VKV28_08270 [Candidatus Binataceae bacterium]|nr:hypothetical protein [Candidatus Binataceae bacterium]
MVFDASAAPRRIERQPYDASERLEKWPKQRRRLTALALFAYEAKAAA